MEKCETAEVVDLLSLYQYFRFDLAGRSIEEQLDLLGDYSPIDYLVFIEIKITASELWLFNTESLDPDSYKINRAYAFIEVYDVQDKRLFKAIEYFGEVNNEVFDDSKLRTEEHWAGLWFFNETPQKIARRCFKKCRRAFFKTYRCL